MRPRLIILIILLVLSIAAFYLVRTETALGRGLESFFEKVGVFLKAVCQKAVDWLKEHIWPPVRQWLENRKTGLEQGIEEEKQEFQEDIKQSIKNILSNTWQRIKNIF